ncbi:MAG: hypothetical protein CMC96_14705 [Flavobacteriales bacterium]|nr:hypothetical protein [Flavobacteriales bacterium]|tara:strand:+ start:46105 stop:46533 length:429 start_codon:yes stop_codon:yes gene_type:complete
MKQFNKILLGFLSILNFSACDSQNTVSDEVKTLREFYSSYIMENAKNELDFQKIDSIKAIYCTDELLEELKNSELEADPFLDVQDYDKTWAENLKIKKSKIGENNYQVCFKVQFDKSNHCLLISLKKEEGKIKINKVKRIDN